MIPHSELQRMKALLNEECVFPPPARFIEKAAVKSMADYEQIYRYSLDHPEQFWAKIGSELVWLKPWDKVLTWKEPDVTWFEGGKTNVSYNCLDRHLAHYADKPAIIWEGEPGDQCQLTYRVLHEAVCQFANALKALGIKKADCVSLYMPLTPELIIATLACARLGVVHNVVFAGYSVQALQSRIHDSKTKCVLTADGGYRRGKIIPLKSMVDEALTTCPHVEKVIVFQRTREPIVLKPGRDVWWHDIIQAQSTQCVAEQLESEDVLFILYTSGSMGAPKGIFHTTAGYMVNAYYTSKIVLDLKPDDVYWCTADIGWITGHTYVIYGPLLNAASVVIYEGAPNWPDASRFWKAIDKYKVSVFYTAPTAIRSFMKWGDEWIDNSDLSTLRLLGSVGEPLNPKAWVWYFKKIGKERCPIVDTWWQTETGAIMVSPIPGATPTKPGSVGKPLPGVALDIVDPSTGKTVPSGQEGALVIRQPWPGMLRGIWNDAKRYKQQYWSQIPSAYFSGDFACYDDQGYIWILGRVDDVIKVSGHRLGSAEIEAALTQFPSVAEAAVVGIPDEITGQSITAFVVLRNSEVASPALKDKIINQVRTVIGALAQPKQLIFSVSLPKTRSGKIMRRLLRDIAAHRKINQDISSLEDFSALIELQNYVENQ